MRRIIMVLFKDKAELDAAVRAFKMAAAARAGSDAYTYIKSHLTQRGVAHSDRHMHPSEVPQGHAFYHD